jgi:hypothetical protein
MLTSSAHIAHCVVIKEGFRDARYPPSLTGFMTKEYPYVLGGAEAVTIGVFGVPGDAVWRVALDMAATLLPRRYYAHLVVGDTLVVAFPACLAFVTRGDEPSTQKAQEIGTLFGIPREQMMFGQLFDEDHPGGQ